MAKEIVEEPKVETEAAPRPQLPKKIKKPKELKSKVKDDYRVTLLGKITKGLKKLKQHSLQKTIRLLQDAQKSKDDSLKKKVDKLNNKFTSLKKLAIPDLKLFALFLMEFEFQMSLKKVEAQMEMECTGFRKSLEELAELVPKKAAKEEIDLKEGNNTVYVAILNFYEFIKTKQQGAFKELTDMIEETKGKSEAKMKKNKDRRTEKKDKTKALRAEGKFVPKEEYWEAKQKQKAEKKVADALAAELKAERLKLFHQKKLDEKIAREAAKSAKPVSEKPVRNWNPSLGKKNTKHGVRKDPAADGFQKKDFQKKDFSQGSDNKFAEKKNFNAGVKTFNKADAFQKPAAGGRSLPDAAKGAHPSWEAKKQLREMESNIDLKKKNVCVEL